MKTNKQVLFITSYPPRECGIATYGQDLVNAINDKFYRSFSPVICALENGTSHENYPSEVKYILNTHTDIEKYITLADKINTDDTITSVLVQHEFGLFSGEFGENILYLLLNLKKPIITTFHTILPNPEEKRKILVKTIIDLSDKVIVMTNTSAKMLENEYQTPSNKIQTIPHGTHMVAWRDKQNAKTKNGYNDRLVLSVFGLLSSNKSIETTLDALPKIKKLFPKILFLIIGKTHPGVLKNEGQKYREFLTEKVIELGLQDNVEFVNRYLTIDELLHYLSLTDIYVFSSKDPHQAVSGTFAYALASGCPIISTPIPHAKEILNESTGAFFDFENPQQLAKEVIRLLKQPELRSQMSLNAFHTQGFSAWENIATKHAKLLNEFANPTNRLLFNYPSISLKHVKAMTTATGFIQFSKLNIPDKNSGYALDDNARALVMLSMLYKNKKIMHKELATIYLNFIEFCQQSDGNFLNYVNIEKEFSQQNHNENLDDANGRTVWALGIFLSIYGPLDYKMSVKAQKILQKTYAHIQTIESPRAMSFAIKGLYLYNQVYNDFEAKQLIDQLSRKLLSKFHDTFDPEWEWFEPYLTYANSIMPEAMLYAYLNSSEQMYKVIAQNSFDFLLQQIIDSEKINVISNKGWHLKGKTKNNYGEQPIDVAYTIITLQLFYKVFGDKKYATQMDIAFSWFLGNNYLQQTIYDPTTGGCCDGLEEFNVNLNQGAESTLCYLMARLTMDEMKLKENEQAMEEHKNKSMAGV